jgi:8-oxo-dGTP pyrophosphatase MutT (NUDIX family)
MEKPNWRRLTSSYAIDSPYMRLRSDTIELPDGTLVSNYYVRESANFVVVLPITANDDVVMIRQYRYGSDEIHLEIPAGMLEEGEDPKECALREMLEETGYGARSCEAAGTYRPEPVRSTARAYIFVARDAHWVQEPQPEATEHLVVELVPLARFREMLRDGTMDSGASMLGGYCGLDYLDRLR